MQKYFPKQKLEARHKLTMFLSCNELGYQGFTSETEAWISCGIAVDSPPYHYPSAFYHPSLAGKITSLSKVSKLLLFFPLLAYSRLLFPFSFFFFRFPSLPLLLGSPSSLVPFLLPSVPTLYVCIYLWCGACLYQYSMFAYTEV